MVSYLITWLSYKTNKRLNFDSIWENQGINRVNWIETGNMHLQLKRGKFLLREELNELKQKLQLMNYFHHAFNNPVAAGQMKMEYIFFFIK